MFDHDWIFKSGIPTQTCVINTILDGKRQVKIGTKMPAQVGWIYGLSLVCGTSPFNDSVYSYVEEFYQKTGLSNSTTPLISDLFLNIKYPKRYREKDDADDEKKKFETSFNLFRVDQLLFINKVLAIPIADSPPVIVPSPFYRNDERYFPVGIPNDVNLVDSFYYNPKKLTTPKVIGLRFHYIDINTYQGMLNDGTVKQYGVRRKKIA